MALPAASTLDQLVKRWVTTWDEPALASGFNHEESQTQENCGSACLVPVGCALSCRPLAR